MCLGTITNNTCPAPCALACSPSLTHSTYAYPNINVHVENERTPSQCMAVVGGDYLPHWRAPGGLLPVWSEHYVVRTDSCFHFCYISVICASSRVCACARIYNETLKLWNDCKAQPWESFSSVGLDISLIILLSCSLKNHISYTSFISGEAAIHLWGAWPVHSRAAEQPVWIIMYIAICTYIHVQSGNLL